MLRLRLVGFVVGIAGGSLAACAGDPQRHEDVPVTAGGPLVTAPPPPPEKKVPKDVSECEPLPKPSTDCHWAIQRPVYCGGPAPPPEMFQPVCACVTCSEDAHCSAKPGGRCAVLLTNESCNAARAVCVYPKDPCWDEKAPRCAKGEQCLGDGGVAHCGTFLPEPPRP